MGRNNGEKKTEVKIKRAEKKQKRSQKSKKRAKQTSLKRGFSKKNL